NVSPPREMHSKEIAMKTPPAQSKNRIPAFFTVVSLASLIVGAAFVGTEAAAQEAANPVKFDEMPMLDALDVRGKTKPETSQIISRINGLRAEIKKILNGEDPLAGNEQKFDGFFNRYLFPRWTIIERIENSNDQVNNFNFLAKERSDFAKYYMRE